MNDEGDAESDLLSLPPYHLMNNYPGHLLHLDCQVYISGPGIKLLEMGPATREQLHLGDSWVKIVHLGIKETSLASRLSTSVRSKTSNSPASSHDKSASLSIIEQWLDVLKMDNRKKNEPVVVSAVIKYRHSFMPATTWLETRTSCTVDVSAQTNSEAAMNKARKGKAKARNSAEMDSSESYRIYNGDPFQCSLVGGVVVRALNPGRDNLRLYSIASNLAPNQANIRPVDALRLLHELRDSFGYGHDHYIGIDLLALTDYYQKELEKESHTTHSTEATAIARSVRRHAQIMVKKLSPQKLMKKPPVAQEQARAASPRLSPRPPTSYAARDEPRGYAAGHSSGSGSGTAGHRTIYEEDEAFYAQIIEGRPPTPRPTI